jgi:hypothetical protein
VKLIGGMTAEEVGRKYILATTEDVIQGWTEHGVTKENPFLPKGWIQIEPEEVRSAVFTIAEARRKMAANKYEIRKEAAREAKETEIKGEPKDPKTQDLEKEKSDEESEEEKEDSYKEFAYIPPLRMKIPERPRNCHGSVTELYII